MFNCSLEDTKDSLLRAVSLEGVSLSVSGKLCSLLTTFFGGGLKIITPVNQIHFGKEHLKWNNKQKLISVCSVTCAVCAFVYFEIWPR